MKKAAEKDDKEKRKREKKERKDVKKRDRSSMSAEELLRLDEVRKARFSPGDFPFRRANDPSRFFSALLPSLPLLRKLRKRSITSDFCILISTE